LRKKCDEGFLLGYSSNIKAYRVFNKTHGIIEEAYDVEFDETNGSQDENENLDDVGGVHLRNAMKTMAIGKIKPMEDDDDSMVVIPSSSTIMRKLNKANIMMKLRMIMFKISRVIRSLLKLQLVIFKLLQEFIIQS
jgi:flagellar motor protein MotB